MGRSQCFSRMDGVLMCQSCSPHRRKLILDWSSMPFTVTSIMEWNELLYMPMIQMSSSFVYTMPVKCRTSYLKYGSDLDQTAICQYTWLLNPWEKPFVLLSPSSTVSVEGTSPATHTSPAWRVGSWQAANCTSKLWQTMERPKTSVSLMS